MNKKLTITSSLYLGLIAIFTIRSLLISNYEFLFYGVILVAFWAVIMKTDKKLNYPIGTLSLLIIWLTGHLVGGTLFVNGTKLYDLMLIPIIGEPYHIFKYDQLMHLLCYITMTRLIFVPLKHVLKPEAPIFLIGLVTILAGSGIGALNEIVEFMAVIFFDAADAVGGYTNTAIDIVANTVGAIIAWFTLLPQVKQLKDS